MTTGPIPGHEPQHGGVRLDSIAPGDYQVEASEVRCRVTAAASAGWRRPRPSAASSAVPSG